MQSVCKLIAYTTKQTLFFAYVVLCPLKICYLTFILNQESEPYTDENLMFNWSVFILVTGIGFATLGTTGWDGKICKNGSVH